VQGRQGIEGTRGLSGRCPSTDWMSFVIVQFQHVV